MRDKKWEKLASEVYCFADELKQALDAIDYEVEGRVWERDEVESNWADVIELVGLNLDAVIREASDIQSFPTAAKRLFQMELGIDPDDSQSPWPKPEPNWRVSGQDGGRDGWLTVEVYAESEEEAIDLALGYMSDPYSGALIEGDETSAQTKADGPFTSVVDEHDGQLDLRATITMPNGFMVEVAIEDVMGSPDVALYAGPGEGDPEKPIPGELVGRWDVARLNERSEA